MGGSTGGQSYGGTGELSPTEFPVLFLLYLDGSTGRLVKGGRSIVLTVVPRPFLSFHAHTSIHTEEGFKLVVAWFFLSCLTPLLGSRPIGLSVFSACCIFCSIPAFLGFYLYACALRVSFFIIFRIDPPARFFGGCSELVGIYCTFGAGTKDWH